MAGHVPQIDGLQNFDDIYVLTQGGPGTSSETLNGYIYQTGFNYLHLGYSSALIMAPLVLALGTSPLSRFRSGAGSTDGRRGTDLGDAASVAPPARSLRRGLDDSRSGRRWRTFLSVFVWMTLIALKNQVDNTAIPSVWIFKPTLQQLRERLHRQILRTLHAEQPHRGLGSTALGLVLGPPRRLLYRAAQAARAGDGDLFSRMAPFIGYPAPWFIMFRELEAHRQLRGPDRPATSSSRCRSSRLMIGFFEVIPEEIEEAAEIDGCSRPRPSSTWRCRSARSGIVVTVRLQSSSPGTFPFALILAGPRTRTVPVAVFSFLSYEQIDWGGLAAAATITPALPRVHLPDPQANRPRVSRSAQRRVELTRAPSCARRRI